MNCKETMLGKQEYVRLTIREVCNELAEMLIQKNTEYGNSALCPLRVFSKADPVEQIRIRMDDKLSRMLTPGVKEIKEDTLMDFVGYVILLKVAERVNK